MTADMQLDQDTRSGEDLTSAALTGDLEALNRALSAMPEDALLVTVGESEATPLHLAAQQGHRHIVERLLRTGRYPYNLPDGTGKLPAEYALPQVRTGKFSGANADVAKRRHEVWDFLVEEGARTELLLLAMKDVEANSDSDSMQIDNGGTEDADPSPNELDSALKESAYLKSTLTITPTRILDHQSNAVMMRWEAPIMRKHAELLMSQPNIGRPLRVLNIGFGMGIIDTFLQEYGPIEHVIVEAHPDILAHMRSQSWHLKPSVTILPGRWQDVLTPEYIASRPAPFDAVYFDTFSGEYSSTLRPFHELLLDLLVPETGRYSFFNGMAGTRMFLNEVYARVVEAELRGFGLVTDWTEMEAGARDGDETPKLIETSENNEEADATWKGVKRVYYNLEKYHLPIVHF